MLQHIFHVLAALLTSSAALNTNIEEFKTKVDNPLELVDKLRRQLMRDNYDYILEATEAASELNANNFHAEKFDENNPRTEILEANTATTLETPIDFYTKITRHVSRTTIKLKDLRRNPMYDQKSKYLMPSDRRKLATSGTDKVLYNESKMRRQNDRFTFMNQGDVNDATVLSEFGNSTTTNTTVKYSVLKVNKPARRSAKQPQLLKEEKQGEVSIVNLGGGAVPPFRLPRPHSQYMRDSDSDQEKSRSPRESLPAVDLD